MSDPKFPINKHVKKHLDEYETRKNAFKAFTEKIDQKIIQMRNSDTIKSSMLIALKKGEFERLQIRFLSSSQDFKSMMAEIQDKSKYGELLRDWNSNLDKELEMLEEKVDNL